MSAADKRLAVAVVLAVAVAITAWALRPTDATKTSPGNQQTPRVDAPSGTQTAGGYRQVSGASQLPPGTFWLGAPSPRRLLFAKTGASAATQTELTYVSVADAGRLDANKAARAGERVQTQLINPEEAKAARKSLRGPRVDTPLGPGRRVGDTAVAIALPNATINVTVNDPDTLDAAVARLRPAR